MYPTSNDCGGRKKRKIQAAAIEGVLRRIQSITSPKAEPFKAWLAHVGAERIEETIDPELTDEWQGLLGRLWRQKLVSLLLLQRTL